MKRSLHGVRCGIEDDTWVAHDPPPPTEGFRLLIAARWIHHPAPIVGTGALPPGWSAVRVSADLGSWTAHHDTAAVLLPGLLDRSGFTVFAHHHHRGG